MACSLHSPAARAPETALADDGSDDNGTLERRDEIVCSVRHSWRTDGAARGRGRGAARARRAGRRRGCDGNVHPNARRRRAGRGAHIRSPRTVPAGASRPRRQRAARQRHPGASRAIPAATARPRGGGGWHGRRAPAHHAGRPVRRGALGRGGRRAHRRDGLPGLPAALRGGHAGGRGARERPAEHRAQWSGDAHARPGGVGRVLRLRASDRRPVVLS